MSTQDQAAAKARDTALQGALTQIERQFGKGSVMRMGDEGAGSRSPPSPRARCRWTWRSGIGGVPRGRIVEIFGPESSGKTTLIYHILAEAQKLGGVCAFIDAEHAMDPLYARNLGVDIDELLVSQPDYGEQALEIADMLVRSGAVDVVAVDSVAALTPRAELEGQMGDQTVGVQARMMSQAMRKLAGNLNRTQTLCLFVNQIREKVGVMFGSPETQPGGRALKFYSSQRLDIRRIETLKDGTEAIGNRVRVKVVKNKVAPPFKQAEFDIEFGKGISSAGCILDLGIEHNVVGKSGSFFSYGDERLGQGRNNAKALPRRAPRDRQGDRGQGLRGARRRPGPRRPDRRRAGGRHRDRARSRRSPPPEGSAVARRHPPRRARSSPPHARDRPRAAPPARPRPRVAGAQPPRPHGRGAGPPAGRQAGGAGGDRDGRRRAVRAGLPGRRPLRPAASPTTAGGWTPGAPSGSSAACASLGVDRELVAAAVGEQDGAAELDAAVALLARRFPSPPATPRECERALGVLVRKGYDLELAHDALRRHAGVTDASDAASRAFAQRASRYYDPAKRQTGPTGP